jgi:hypothetical protein
MDIPTSAEALAGITIAKEASIKELVKVRFIRDCINPPFTAWIMQSLGQMFRGAQTIQS